jgi:type VI secretion system secreted protein VgrG
MDDWAYIHMLMQQEGIYCYFVAGKFGDELMFGDDIDHYLYKPKLQVPYREPAGLSSDQEAVHALQTHVETVQASFMVADYNPDKAWERYKAEANIASQDRTTYGQPYVYGTHHLDQAGARWEAQLRHEAAIAWQVVYEGESTVLDLCPARVLRLDLALPDAPHGQVVVAVTHSGGRDRTYTNRYQAIPCERRFRLKIEDAKWPKIAGTLSARVTSPQRYTYAYMTEQGHYRVRFDFDFDTWPAGSESVPLRLAKPFAGGRQTGFHFPLIDGTEVAVAFRDGDPNKPYIAHALHNSIQTDLLKMSDRWMARNVIRTQSNNKLRFDDWKGEEHVKLATEHGKSQLNLGYMADGRQVVRGRRNKRGAGFELRTDEHGAIRAGKGLFISADRQEKAAGGQLDMGAATQHLEQTLEQMQRLNEAARSAQADMLELKAQNTLLRDQVKGLQDAVLLLSAPAGVVVATPTNMRHSAGANLMLNASQHVNISAWQRFTVAAGEAISLFAQKAGIKLFANKGTVQIHAQNDAMDLLARQDLTLTSTEGRLVIRAKKEILFNCDDGSYLQLKDGKIHLGTRGEILCHTTSLQKRQPATLSAALPNLPKSELKSQRFDFRFRVFDEPGSSGHAVAQVPWKIVSGTEPASMDVDAARVVAQGLTDQRGDIVLSDEQQQSVSAVYCMNPMRTWLVYPGHVVRVNVEHESSDWSDDEKKRHGLNAADFAHDLHPVTQDPALAPLCQYAEQAVGTPASQLYSTLKA